MQENPQVVAAQPQPQPPKKAWGAIKSPKPTAFYLSVVALLLVVGFSAFFFVAKMQIDANIVTEQTNIDTLTKQITTAKANKTILIADVLQKNLLKPSINLRSLVDNFRAAASAAWVRFSGFSIQNDTLSTTLIATESINASIHNDPATAIINLMRTSSGGTVANTNFTLEPITHVSGDITARTSDIAFRIVPTSSN